MPHTGWTSESGRGTWWGRLGLLVNQLGLIVDRDCATANFHGGTSFQHLVDEVTDQMVVFSDESFEKTEWHPTNLRVCARSEWNSCVLIETVLSMVTTICHFKQVTPRVWAHFESRLAYTTALFNILVQ
jgi:hypothetical protein